MAELDQMEVEEEGLRWRIDALVVQTWLGPRRGRLQRERFRIW